MYNGFHYPTSITTKQNKNQSKIGKKTTLPSIPRIF